MSDERLVSANQGQEEAQVEKSLRPRRLDEFIGQEKVVEQLRIAITAAKRRGEPLDHTLFYGPPGLGKTSLSNVLANEMGVNIKLTSGPAIERAGDLAAILTNLQKDDILFIDEIHRLNRAIEEVLYPAMEDFALDLMVGKGPSARNLRLKLPPFTTIGATTRLALLTGPLRDRFGSVHRLEFYSDDAMYEIVTRSSNLLNVPITPEGAREIGRRARGTPRIANRLLRRVRDFAEVRGDGRIDAATAKAGLEVFGIDDRGLDKVDRAILQALCQQFGGGPVGLSTLAIAVGEQPETVEDMYEPFLIQQGFLARTPRGRVAMPAAYEHLGMTPPSLPAAPAPGEDRPPGLFD